MATTGKTARELQAMILDKLRADYPQCDDVIVAVIVTQSSGAHGKWMVETVTKEGALEPSDCHRARVAITQDLQQQFHLVLA